MEYVIVKWLHVLFSTLLFGTGIGSAFYLLRASLGRNPVVVADCLFTSTTAVLQPLTGFWLIDLGGLSVSRFWLKWSIVLYVVAIACWLPVVPFQTRLRDVAGEAVREGRALPPLYGQLFRIWFALGVPAFLAFVGIFYLMVTKLQ